MELRPISDLAGWYARELSEAFPENERKPLADMMSEMERGCYEPLGLYEGQALLGYATLWSREAFPGYVLLDYLGWTDAGRVVAPGVWTEGSIRNTPFPEQAYRLGKGLRLKGEGAL